MTNITLTAGELPAFTADPKGAHASSNWWSRLLRAIARRWKHAQDERRVRARIQDLREVDDWLLADMGLTRGAIAHAVRNGHPRDL